MTELNQKNRNHNFITQWNYLNIFVTIGGIMTNRILESGDEVKKIKHFNPHPAILEFYKQNMGKLGELFV